jgi:hypothetical protein
MGQSNWFWPRILAQYESKHSGGFTMRELPHQGTWTPFLYSSRYITWRKEARIAKHDKACFHFGERFYACECLIFENIGDDKSNDSF